MMDDFRIVAPLVARAHLHPYGRRGCVPEIGVERRAKYSLLPASKMEADGSNVADGGGTAIRQSIGLVTGQRSRPPS